MEDESYYVQEHAAQALVRITGQDFGTNQRKWRRWWKKNEESFTK
jgi:hypothetical protein